MITITATATIIAALYATHRLYHDPNGIPTTSHRHAVTDGPHYVTSHATFS